VLDPRFIEDLGRRLSKSVPESARILQEDLEKTFRAILTSTFERLHLVTREELDVQQAVLARTRERLSAMEARVAELEKLLKLREAPRRGEAPPGST
jgi:BMFP domain-containing protein YqiC